MIKFGTIDAGGTRTFLNQEDTKYAALLIEPKRREMLQTKFGEKDTIIADITCFETAEDVDSDNGEFRKDVKVQHNALVKKIEHLIGAAAVARLVYLEPSANYQRGAYVWNNVDDSLQSKVIEYANRREAAKKDALEEMPDFT